VKNQQQFIRRKAIHVAVAAALPVMLMTINPANATPVASPVVPVGAKNNGATDPTGGVGGVPVNGYTGGSVTLGDGSVQTITGGFLPRVVQTNNNGLINAGSFVVGRKYFIQTLGTTNFTALGAASNTLGESFIATSTGTGSGVATDSANVIGGYNSLDNLKLTIKANTTITQASPAAVLVEDDVIEGLITQKNYSIGVMTNGGSTITNYGHIVNTDGGQSTNVGVQLGNDGDKLIVKSGGTVSTSVTTTSSTFNTAKAYGVNTDAAGDYAVTVEQGASISASHAGVGGAYAIDGGGSSNTLIVENSGTISGTRVNALSSLTASNVNATTLKAVVNGLSAASVGNVAAVYVQEELDTLTLNNRKTGILETTGDLTDVIYGRAWEQNINNEGIIRVNGYTAGNKNGIAIASVSDSLREEQLNVNNSGSISGDIVVSNGNALRYWAIKKYNAGATFGGNPIENTINSGAGQINSNITNSGTITGDIYYNNGTHVLTNDGGAITGNINVDQRDTVCGAGTGAGQTCSIKAGSITAHALTDHLQYTVGADTKVVNDTDTSYNGNFTVHGTKEFTLESSGTLTGNVNIITVDGLTGTYSNVYGVAVSKENSLITLVPVITGAGSATAAAAAGSTGGFIDGTLTIRTAGVDSAAATTTLAPKVQAGTTVKSGDWYKVATTYTNAGSDLPTTQNSALVSWTAEKNGSALVVGATVGNASSLGFAGNTASLVDAALSSNTAGALVQNLATAADISRVAEQLRPEINNANVEAAIGVTDRVFGLVDAHLNETHLAQLTGKSGIATGEQANGTGVWLQGFGGRGDQDRRNNVDGYTSDAYGFAAGADTLVGEGTRIGAAISYGQSNIEDKGVNSGNKSNIDSYQATLYGSAVLDGWYLNGTLGLGKHNYDSKRLVLGNFVSGSHDAWQYTARVDAGLPFKVGTATLTPIASLTYSRLNQDGYTETGIGALVIGSNDTDSFRSGLGAKALIPLTDGEVKTGLELRAIWNHEFGDTAQDTTANFVGGGSTFTTSGASVARDGLNLGGSLVLAHSDAEVQQNLLLSYDAEVKDQYLNQTARLQARFDF